jgi:DNA-binding PadR family transcriptional regulator
MSRCGVNFSPTATTHALLGLLALRSWTTYELAKQVPRSLRWFWPRAERKLYDEPKRLADAGLVSVTEGFTGKRRRREYTITAEGLAELSRWLGAPSSGRSLEFEDMLKVFFADSGSQEQLLATLDRIEQEARSRLGEIADFADSPGQFPERSHIGAVCLDFFGRQERAVLDWAGWAREQISAWNDPKDPAGWDPDPALRRTATAARKALTAGGPPGEAAAGRAAAGRSQPSSLTSDALARGVT